MRALIIAIVVFLGACRGLKQSQAEQAAGGGKPAASAPAAKQPASGHEGSPPAVPQVAATHIVAVMPFKDLSGGGSPVGEAIRETVSVDLREVPDIRVVERGAIDKVFGEQSLQATKADLDPLSAVRVGRLLGASLLVVGGFQRSGTKVRMTARFVKVQTGEIIGTAKVDGLLSDLFKLQDRVTVELLKSMGIVGSRAEGIADRKRPKVGSFKAIELYGTAVSQEDGEEKAEVLKLALAEDPGFSYAAADLDALEKRLRAYAAASEAAQAAASRELAEKIAHERDPGKAYDQTWSLVVEMVKQHRCRRTLDLLRGLQATNPPPGVKYNAYVPNAEAMVTEIAFQRIQTMTCLKMDDQVLLEGERFLKDHPTYLNFKSLRMQLESIMRERRIASEGAGKAAAAIARLRRGDRSDPCRNGSIYHREHQYREARRELVQCLALGIGKHRDPATVIIDLAWASYELGDFKASRSWLSELEVKYPDAYRDRGPIIANRLPVDD